MAATVTEALPTVFAPGFSTVLASGRIVDLLAGRTIPVEPTRKIRRNLSVFALHKKSGLATPFHPLRHAQSIRRHEQ